MGNNQQDNPENISVIILAAGSSSRLGQSKQLVMIDGVPLLLKSTLASLDAKYLHVVVVLGANAAEHKKMIAHLPVEILTNTEWENGMGSSLKKGLRYVLKSKPATRAIVVMVCDQPLLTQEHLAALRHAYTKTNSQIVASRYGGMKGVPALFDYRLFPSLMEIDDSQGAKVVIEAHSETVHTIDWEDGHLDIDTPEDLNLLNSQ